VRPLEAARVAIFASASSGDQPYLRLPRGLISRRTRTLAETLVDGKETPMDKALALRDHLRQNYTYSLTPRPIPSDAEVVDFFLFESREGYCQHFAQALTVLARLAGLPARLATGYSPGQYDLLSDCFEVYEYHAHAWSQVFVVPYGWLTMDGVAPGNLQLRSKPSMLSQLLDPFGDEWESRPPELAVPKEVLRAETRDKGGRGSRSGKMASALEAVVRDAMQHSDYSEPRAHDYAKALFTSAAKGLRAFWDTFRSAVYSWLRDLWSRALAAGRRIVRFYLAMSPVYHGLLIAVLGATFAVVRNRSRILQRYRRWRVRRRCEYLWEQLRHRSGRSPTEVVSVCYRFVCEVLSLGPHTRPARMDLLEYLDWLANAAPEVGGDLNVIFRAFVRQHFGGRGATEADARSTLECAARVRARLLSQSRAQP